MMRHGYIVRSSCNRNMSAGYAEDGLARENVRGHQVSVHAHQSVDVSGVIALAVRDGIG